MSNGGVNCEQFLEHFTRTIGECR